MDDQKVVVKSFGSKRAKPDTAVLLPGEAEGVAGGITATGTISCNFIAPAGDVLAMGCGGDGDG